MQKVVLPKEISATVFGGGEKKMLSCWKRKESEHWWKVECKREKSGLWHNWSGLSRGRSASKAAGGSRDSVAHTYLNTRQHIRQHTHRAKGMPAKEGGWRGWGVCSRVSVETVSERASAAATPASASVARTHLPSSSSSLPCAPLSPSLRHC